LFCVTQRWKIALIVDLKLKRSNLDLSWSSLKKLTFQNPFWTFGKVKYKAVTIIDFPTLFLCRLKHKIYLIRNEKVKWLEGNLSDIIESNWSHFQFSIWYIHKDKILRVNLIKWGDILQTISITSHHP
jgi:hypothetical protein